MTHIRVLMLKTPPLGTSGVRVIVSIEMQSTKSLWTISFWISHFVDLGPKLPFKGLMYDILRARQSWSRPRAWVSSTLRGSELMVDVNCTVGRAGAVEEEGAAGSMRTRG